MSAVQPPHLQPQQQPQPQWQQVQQRPLPAIGGLPRLSRGSLVGTIVGISVVVLLAIAGILVLGFFQLQFGNPIPTVIAGIMALVPLAFVVWAVLAIDRWEPEPKLALWCSALWGGTMAVLLTLVVNQIIEGVLIAPILSQPAYAQHFVSLLNPLFPAITDANGVYEFYATVIQAPVMEELWKATPVLAMFFFVRRHFDGPVDGIVIAALSAAGFAYTENILYFGRQLLESGDASFIFFLRGVMSPLTHAIFTALGVGLALGVAARYSSRLWGLVAFPIGWFVAAGLHALWNSASFWVPGGMLGFFLYYGLVQVPICVGAVLLVLLLRRFEARITQVRLKEYASAGWFSEEEAVRLSTSDGRSGLLQWARRRGLRRAMDAYIRIVTRLAANRQRAIIGREKLRPVADEARLLGDVATLRRHMATVAGGGPVQIGQGQLLPAPQPGLVPDAQRFAPVRLGNAQPTRTVVPAYAQQQTSSWQQPQQQAQRAPMQQQMPPGQPQAPQHRQVPPPRP